MQGIMSYLIGDLTDKSFQAIICTGTDMQTWQPTENTYKDKEANPKTNEQTGRS